MHVALRRAASATDDSATALDKTEQATTTPAAPVTRFFILTIFTNLDLGGRPSSCSTAGQTDFILLRRPRRILLR
jgi:hypothetical protein